MRKTNKVKTSAIVSEIELEQRIQSEPENVSLWRDPFVHILLILLTAFIVYFNTINVPFLFDDHTYLLRNPGIKSFDCFPDTRKVLEYAILQDVKNNLILRPVAYFTFAMNYAIHGFDLFGYHMLNLLLHIGCGILVYCFFWRLMMTPTMADKGKPGPTFEAVNPGYLSLFAALLFVSHPVQTQAITYIIQRFVPLASFFYLAALVLYLEFRRASATPSRILAYIFSLVATVFAMESKEIAFTLPLILVLIEMLFFSGSIFPRLLKLVPFLFTMAIIPRKLMWLPSSVSAHQTENISDAINLVNMGGTSSWDYLLTQFGVIVTYIRLMFLPIGQNLDYDYPLQQSIFKLEVLIPLAAILLILGSAIYLLQRSRENKLYKIIAFGIFWFFITLSVESSIVPIEDLIFEHRVYLPSIGFFITFLAIVSVIFKRFTGKIITNSALATSALCVVIACLSATSVARNMVWQNEVVFWNDVVKKSPHKARPYRGLGVALLQQTQHVVEDNNMSENVVLTKSGSELQIISAINALKESIRLQPKNPTGYISLAEALILHKNYDDSLRALATASELIPKSAIPYVMRGKLYEAKKDVDLARQEYLQAIKVDPLYYEPHLKLAHIYTKEGNIQEAIKEFEIVMQINPDKSVQKNLNSLKARQFK